jgi:hypothetical protein
MKKVLGILEVLSIIHWLSLFPTVSLMKIC